MKIWLTICLGLVLHGAQAATEQTQAMNAFIDKMVEQHEFQRPELEALFQQVEIKQKILDVISRPAEGMPWYRYRKIFIQPARIEGGVKFWQTNLPVLQAVEQQYGVPAEIITAIIGVETFYGQRTGGYRVIDALATLGFAYPKRSQFFLSELENFLLLTRQENVDPLKPLGSYAGAMGMPQFMPSSYLSYAADFEQDGKRDIWQNPADAIASVANYFARHHWHKGEAIVFPVVAEGEQWKKQLHKGLKPDQILADLKQHEIYAPDQLADETPVKLLSFEQADGQSLWIGLHNFYVITRYNHSPLYAMAVYQLSRAIKDQYLAGQGKQEPRAK
jgi:membrane-bound lytic murein transglycosylase B